MGNKSSSSASGAGDGSASTIIADAVTESHVLRINGYSKTKGLGVAKFISSVAFSVGGHSWKIIYYPGGFDERRKGWISIFLRLADVHVANKDNAIAQLKLSLLDEAGRSRFTRTSSKTWIFSKGSDTWGFHQFIKKKSLESSSHLLKDDSFQIRCHVTVVKIRAEDTSVQLVAAPSGDLARDLGGLLDSKVGGDVKFKVGREVFTVHRYILAARSPVFKAELFGQMREKKASQIRIDDMEAKVFKAMLHFIYTDSLPRIDESEKRLMAQHLLVAADRYGLQRLKLVSEETLCNFVDISTAATTLAVAEQHGCHRLKERCFRFLLSPGNMKAVMATDGYEHLMRSCPSLLNELLEKVAP